MKLEVAAGVVLAPWLSVACYAGLDSEAQTDTAAAATETQGGGDADDSDGDDDEPLPEPDDDPPAPGAEFECETDLQDPGPTMARRLNRAEVLATIQDVLNVDATDLTDQLALDYRAEGFSNTANALIITTDDVEKLASVAQTVVTRIGDLGGLVAQHSSCASFSADCEEDFIRGIGLRLYRRPLTAAEVASLIPLFEHAQSEGEQFEYGAGAVIEAMLQAPPFLYRLESQTSEGTDGPYRDLDGYEVASRLSYLVVGSAPDAALLQAADDGTLADPTTRLEHVRRLAASPRGRATSVRFVGDWAHLSRLDHLDLSLADDLRAETQAFFEHLVWEEERPLTDLFNADYTFASEALAEAYGLGEPIDGGPGATVARYDLSGLPGRAGLVTQGAVLSWEDGRASIVQRGLFVLREVICGGIAPPPAGVNDTAPDPEPGRSKRVVAEERMETQPCGGCHRLFDPMGFAFEQYDGQGMHMLQDEHGNDLRSDGALNTQFHDNIPFADATELADLLAADERVADCMLLKVGQFSIGRRLAVSDGCTLRDVRDTVRDSGGTYQDLLEAIVSQPSFAQIRIDEGE